MALEREHAAEQPKGDVPRYTENASRGALSNEAMSGLGEKSNHPSQQDMMRQMNDQLVSQGILGNLSITGLDGGKGNGPESGTLGSAASASQIGDQIGMPPRTDSGAGAGALGALTCDSTHPLGNGQTESAITNRELQPTPGTNMIDNSIPGTAGGIPDAGRAENHTPGNESIPKVPGTDNGEHQSARQPAESNTPGNDRRK
jgi:hypothetical protein